jgi:hypothetical protein
MTNILPCKREANIISNDLYEKISKSQKVKIKIKKERG